MKIIFLGAPGAGKGTQAENVSKMLDIPCISTGEILRGAVAAGTPLGLAAKSFIEAGKLVPDDIITDIIKERIAKPEYAKGYILDGFPRTVAQAEYIDKSGLGIDLVVNIDVPDEKIISRMSGRRVCLGCGASFHVEYKPSAHGEKCDKCDNGQLAVRKDDEASVVRERLVNYHRMTEPLIEFYQKKGILETIIGQEEVADTNRLMTELITKVTGQKK